MYLRYGGMYNNHIMQMVCRVCQWKNFKNW